ncbi:TetR/AcrR family transcriptional regulator [Streptomyces sp. DSM 44917]|uniref:TetR/AcrR family transcriptional regulator n=1 Tax=Streptomyces boetiae TaxID=3075541 RepID=A0ABU2LA96_9ACTN|nr:TetR/AcrR family transcriptional regulator [Streptomyces sp. DSM 44917]MDT0308484.1 TetR/AcrR family transcriptional regulator [Streptomyces sp. DSM 44917]
MPDTRNRPAAGRQAAGRQAIIDAAREEFAARGFDAASVRDIAARAGVSLSALYHYYPGKQALLEGIIATGLEAYFASCTAALAAAGEDPARRLTALVAATVRHRAHHRVDSRIVLGEARSVSPEFRVHHRARLREATALFADAITAGLTRGTFTTPHPDDARRAVIAMCNAVAQWYDPTGPTPVPTLERHYADLALTLVGYRPAVPEW